MEISIRRIDVKDVATLSKISKQTFYDTFTGTCTESDMDSFLQDYFNENQMAKELFNPNDLYFFAEVENTPVGYIRFMEDYSNFEEIKKWKSLELKRLYILKEYHGKGIAQSLMNFFLAFAHQQKFETVWLGVWENNFRAQKFYKKYGFESSGHTHAFPIGNTPQTDIWFWKFL